MDFSASERYNLLIKWLGTESRKHAISLKSWGPYAAFHGMAIMCHIEGSRITAI
jgi:hypothetical protein